MIIDVPVVFNGVVKVEVPDTVPADQRQSLAEVYALSKVLATTNNPDAPDDYACNQYAEEFGLSEDVAGEHYDAVTDDGVVGDWTTED